MLKQTITFDEFCDWSITKNLDLDNQAAVKANDNDPLSSIDQMLDNEEEDDPNEEF